MAAAGTGLPCDSGEPWTASRRPSILTEEGRSGLSERKAKERRRFGEGERSDSSEPAADIMSADMMSAIRMERLKIRGCEYSQTNRAHHSTQ